MKNKGFTLVELLAVLIVLAVLALIAIPAIMQTIESSRMGTFRDSAFGLMNAAKQSYVEYAGTTMTIDMKTSVISVDGTSTGKKISYKGVKPKGGIVTITANGDISLTVYNEKYCAYRQVYEDDITVKKINDPSECTVEAAH